MRIAYIVLAHTDPGHIGRLARKLTADTNDAVFIHVDLKTEQRHFASHVSGSERTHFVQERVAVYWAGFNSIKATVNAFEQALHSGDFDRFVILQGLDYPIRSSREIHEFFDAHPKTEFIRAVDETATGGPRDLHKYCLYWRKDLPRKLGRVVNAPNVLLLRSGFIPRFKPPWVEIDGRRASIYPGWAHFALTREAAGYVTEFFRSHPGFNRFFRHVYAADESYFHTIIHNSSFSPNVREPRPESREVGELLNVTYFEYPPHGVREYREMEEYQLLRDSGMLFFRKVTSKGLRLLDHIDAIHSSEPLFTSRRDAR